VVDFAYIDNETIVSTRADENLKNSLHKRAPRGKQFRTVEGGIYKTLSYEESTLRREQGSLLIIMRPG